MKLRGVSFLYEVRSQGCAGSASSTNPVGRIVHHYMQVGEYFQHIAPPRCIHGLLGRKTPVLFKLLGEAPVRSPFGDDGINIPSRVIHQISPVVLKCLRQDAGGLC